MARGALAGATFQLVEQIGRQRPAVRTDRSGEPDTLELAESPAAWMFGSVQLPLQRVHTSLSACSVGELAVDWTYGGQGLGLERNDVANAEPFGGASAQRNVIRVSRRRLDHGVDRTLEFIGEALVGHAPGQRPRVGPLVGGQGLSRSNDSVPAWIASDGFVNLLQDVAS